MIITIGQTIDKMEKRFVIIHHNTPLLTECLVRSINHFVKDAIIYIFDNSDKEPFTTKFDNVIILDNTKGEIIDFDKWLKNYPNRLKSNGKSNYWGSAKHCYSVEKCMELIGKNFILLDSDVLLKKDCSDLFDENYIYCGDIVIQPKSTIKRVLPFICFINVEMCKKNNIHYFDENYMHGLCYNNINKHADSYDTGASFYLSTNKFPHKEIDFNDYIIHYGHGSWNKNDEKKILTPNEWLSLNKRFYTNEMNKNVIYTCIVGNYDSLIDPKYISEGFDYVCFTDNLNFKSDIWIIKPLPNDVENLPQIKKQRCIKINPHKYLSEYDLSIWVDGNVTINGDLNELVSEVVNDDCSIYIPKHPSRDCIYNEASIVISIKKDTKENVEKQIERYRNKSFPKNYGLLQSNILIRKHNNKDCIKLMESWFKEVKNGSHRDQLSFNYCLWLNQDICVLYLDKNIYKSKWFTWNYMHKKQIQDTIKEDNKTIEKKRVKRKITTNVLSFY